MTSAQARSKGSGLDFELLAPLAMRQASLFARSEDDRESIAQEALARAWAHRDRFDATRGTGEAWLFGFVRNVARERHRSQGREAALWRRLIGREAAPIDDRAMVVAALERLSTEDQHVLFLRYWMDLSYRDMADQLGIGEATGRQRVRRAVARLGRHLR